MRHCARRSDGSNSDNSEGLLNTYNLNASSKFPLQTLEGNLTINSYVSDVKVESYDALPDGIASGWNDSDGGRESHSIEKINAGILGDRIIFNTITISDEDKHKYPEGTISHEKNFVAARVNNGSHGSKNVWQGNLIEVREGEEYFIRIYCHNNNPNRYAAAAEDVEAFFHVPTETGRTVVVHGFFQSSNASPTWYSDGVVLTSDRFFHLEYIPGSALLENNGIGSSGGQILDDKIVNESWTKIGYSDLDGEIPGCYQYDSYLTIRVKPIFEE